jgi:hypothetical protein
MHEGHHEIAFRDAPRTELGFIRLGRVPETVAAPLPLDGSTGSSSLFQRDVVILGDNRSNGACEKG